MQGVTIKKAGTDYSVADNETFLTLIGENEGLEIMIHSIKSNDFVMLTPSYDPGLKEFVFIISGNVVLEKDDEIITLSEKDFFSFCDLDSPIIMRCNAPVKLLYITSKPTFENVETYVKKLDELVNRVDEKDKYTKHHCEHVLEYSIAISQKMKCSSKITENLAIAALFHDVGKCYMPDSVLNKISPLTTDERKFIIKHPINSKELVETKFGKDIANIVLCHHERLDGSGYPLNLQGDEIPIESRIIAVADSFDAMTTKRPYNNPKSFETAANELLSLTELYDESAARALKELVDSGEIYTLAEKKNGQIIHRITKKMIQADTDENI